MAKLAELYTELTARDAGLQSKLGAVRGQLTGLGSSLARLGPMVAAAFAAIAGSSVLRSIVTQASEAEDAVLRLDVALKNSENGGSVSSAMLQQLAKDMSSITTHSDEAIMGAMSLALNYGVAAERMGPMMRAAVGLSRAIGVDLQTAVRYATMAENGEYDALARLLPQLRGVTDATRQREMVQRLMNAGYEQEKAALSTASGKWGELKKSVDELSESLGNLIAGPLKDWLDRLGLIVQAMTRVIEQSPRMAEAASKALWVISPATAAIGALFDKMYGKENDFYKGMIDDLRRRGLLDNAAVNALPKDKSGNPYGGPLRGGQADPLSKLTSTPERSGGFANIADFAKQLQLAAFDAENREREKRKVKLMEEQRDFLKVIATESPNAARAVVGP